MIAAIRFAIAFVLVGALAMAAPDAHARTLKITIAAKSPLYAPYFIAVDKGYYAAEGLTVEFVDAAGGVATPALLSGTVDVSTSSASALSAIIRGAPLKIIYTMANRLPDQLWTSRPELKTLRDLKGLTVGIASRGDTYEIALRSSLSAAGLPQNWIGYTPLGFAPAVRLSALISGSLPAVMITPIDLAPALASGSLRKCHMMIDFMKILQLPYTGAAVSDRLLKSDPALVEGFLRATIKGVRYALAFEPQTVAILHKRNPRLDPKAIGATYRVTVPTMTKAGTASDDLIRRDLAVRAAILNMDAKSLLPISKIYNYDLTRKVTAELDASGWQPTP
jgi:ABC-type nitrate/sulfonate/bicarbonate transport system substrate-binding protein